MAAIDNKPHSSDYLGEHRDMWWNKDYINLFKNRWDLDKVQKVLDAGCGIGHWGHVLSAVLPESATLIGIDREEAWVEQATIRAEKEGLSTRYSYQLGDATKLDFPDEYFDMVTCQTLLIHVADPLATIKEFIRVLKPGGLLAVAEPNNLAASLFLSSLDFHAPIDEVLQYIKFQFICERGKEILQLGNISIGEALPGYFSQCSLHNIQVYLSDKCIPIFPPYNSPEQSLCIESIKENVRDDFWIWDRETTAKYFYAGYRDQYPSSDSKDIEEIFNHNWDLLLQKDKDILDSTKNNQFSATGSSAMYLVSGIKN